MKAKLREMAILLRREGYSYSEILNQVPVAKSTLSLWLRVVGLSAKQKQRLTEKRISASKRGGNAKREQRIEITEQIRKQAILEIKNISTQQLFIMGIMLYWAEGAKSKDHNLSQGFIFSNSDPMMIKLMLKWVRECLHISEEQLVFEIYMHDNFKDQIPSFKRYWATETGLPVDKFDKIYLKKNKLVLSRKNIGLSYWGQVRIKIRKSTNLNRKISSWINGLCSYCGVV